ncbi:phage tail tip lysozyme [Reyranella sp.]|jgi:hypothetical protein|uniref:phage tail tip lysozyme n=1 Tax=Reyranella sp. TaxID=1929291 RepID=UPI000BC60E6C|nr:phage tail tip lysozyme [Reyranella sp.]OYY46071.1 MAG: hypothetical protein B7Y57_04245 [Rhodospirillales bacterium 35-66-84]OYZ96451.1 MAG: hypothetical protein B7Y08_04605 [Rhodospirillales bacterium 24-66-33]OZB28386.1 MAG: hypothetical protein B7X63_00540 [Rhodospirillales bacterium 39-66-50]HQS14405.1 phage tail tip lysozyme [Reyranella sp.]HQT11402.1 phage tail tip lysozyme [Reyranella sp.]
MAVFATSADMRRPVPRADGVGNYRPAAAALPGLEGAEALNQAGQQNQQIGGMLGNLGEQLDVAAAQEAIAQLRAKRKELTFDPEKGFQRLKGGDATKPGPGGKPLLNELPAGLQSISEGIAETLLSPRAKAIFRRAARDEQTSYKRDLAVHLAAESERFEVATFKDLNALDLTEIVQVSDNPAKVDAITTRMERRTRAFYEARGLPSEAAATAATSNALRAVIESQAASGNGSQALATFQRFAPKLDAADRIALMPTMRTVQQGETARFQARDLVSSVPTTEAAEAGTKASLAFWKGEYGEKVSAGITAGFLRESQFSTGARNRGDGRDGSDSINIGQWNGPRAQAFLQFAKSKGLDPNDRQTGMLYARAEIDGEIPRAISGLSPDFKARLQNAKSEAEAADIMTRGYFRPLYQDGESAVRGKSATAILAKYGEKDPLRQQVDAATGTDKPKDGPLYRDTRQMLVDAETAYDTATRRNAEINAGNDAQRRATQSQLDLNLAEQKRQIDMAKLNLEIAVDKWMTTGGQPGPDGQPSPATKRPPPEIWNQLSYTKQQSIDATIAHNAKGQDVVTDQRVWYEIQQGLTSPDQAVRAQWANKPLWEYKRYLSNGDFQELSKIQSTARQGDPNKQLTRILNANQMIDDTLLTLGVGIGNTASKGDAEKANNFRRLAQQQITAFEVEQKRTATPEEQRKIIDRLALPTFLRKGVLWGEDTKPAYEVTITDVPATEREKIVEALRGRGLPMTDDAIVDLYRRANARSKK